MVSKIFFFILPDVVFFSKLIYTIYYIYKCTYTHFKKKKKSCNVSFIIFQTKMYCTEHFYTFFYNYLKKKC